MELIETAALLLMIVVITGSGITVLPWYDQEWRSSARAFGALNRLMSLKSRPSAARPAEIGTQPAPTAARA